MAFQTNQVVNFHYTLKNEDGTTLESTVNSEPMGFLAGQGQILPKLEQALGEMKLNEKRTITLAPADAYGEFRPDAIQTAQRSNFPPDTKLESGMQFWASMEDGQQMPFVIKEVKGDEVTIDFNHPLAGMTLTFDVEFMGTREATEEEIAHGHIHGPGGHHH